MTAHDVVDVGLDQMDDDGLRRVIAHVDAGKPVCLTGFVVDMRTGHT